MAFSANLTLAFSSDKKSATYKEAAPMPVTGEIITMI